MNIQYHQRSKRIINIELEDSIIEKLAFNFKKFDILTLEYKPFSRFTIANVLDEITSKLLSIRKIKKEEINSFLNPLIKNFLPNPNILLDMEKATSRTFQTILNGDKIGIFGDYDVDGATSTALLGNYLSELNLNYEIYIPDRKKEGYGPSIKSFRELIDKGVKLIFTVDCGTLSFEAINFAKKNNIDVIVLDHHQSEVKLPKAYSIINTILIDDQNFYFP